MKTVTSAFETAQAKSATYPITYIYYKRRYWNGSNAYIWETNWTQLTRSELVSVDPIIRQFDTQTLNEFKVSNVVLRLKNLRNEWKEGNTSGKFAADGVSSNGYEPYLMKFQIRSGFANVGGTDARVGDTYSVGSEELLTIFTGFAVDYQYDTMSGHVQITVEGLERLLLNGDATQVSTAVSLETIGTGDGETKEFYTEHNGVSTVTAITVNSVTQTPGTDYEIANLNDFNEPAKITLSQPATSGHAVKCSYRHWKKNQTVEQLISDLVSEAGITSTDIDNATLGNIYNNITLSSKSEFDDGTNVGIDLNSEYGSINVDISDETVAGTLISNFNSGTLSGAGFSGSGSSFPVRFGIVSSALKLNCTVGEAEITNDYLKYSYSNTPSFSVWALKVKHGGSAQGIRFYFSVDSDTLSSANGYYLYFNEAGSGGLRLVKMEAGTDIITLIDDTVGITSSYQEIKIVRNYEGIFYVYLDDVLKLTLNDPDGTDGEGNLTGDRFFIEPLTTGNSAFIDDLYIPSANIVCSHESKTIDTISGLSSWGNLTVNQQSQSGVFSYQTRVSSDNSIWDSLVAVSATNGINSAVKRYIRVKITFTLSTSTLPDIIPKVFSYNVQFNSDRVFIALGDFSGMSCYQAIQELAKFSDFEWGLDDNETFFFRTRTVSSTPDETFTQAINLSNILYLKNGYENTYAIVRAQFGEFTSEEVAAADVRTSALEIYGRRVFNISSNMLINPDTNVADGIAATYFTRLSSKRRRLRIRTKYWPQIELSDTLSVTFNHDAFTSPAVEPFLNALICKVIGTKHDTENAVSEFDLEEIL